MTTEHPYKPYEDIALTKMDLHLFNEGRHFHLHEKLGAHPCRWDQRHGVHFAVWAPNAREVSVIGEFNDWQPGRHVLSAAEASGIWTGFFEDVAPGTQYKYHITSGAGDYRVAKADPFAFYAEEPPRTASVVWSDDFKWNDAEWMEKRSAYQAPDQAMSVYEMHLGSWRRKQDPETGEWVPLTYRELAETLPQYLSENGFTHVELLPITEHPFYGSWGYQVTGYFAPTSRYGTPDDFKHLVDRLHQAGIGVYLDWVPSHFPSDEHGLSYFDGTHLFEHEDPRQGYHPDWKSYIYNFGRNEVRSFLISSAMHWLGTFHLDGLRVDAVASMLYLDYSREGEDWVPNRFGGRENLEAIEFLKQLNEAVYHEYPGIQMIAEESTAWPMVSRPTYLGGLGFGMKWDMGWMHDTLQYFQRDPVYRKYHQGELTFRMIYAFNENFVLSLSHDEVVHGKGSMLNKMPGDDWQKFANLRSLYAYMFAQPGKKLLFMGDEFGQDREWNHESSLDWHLLEAGHHDGLASLVRNLNRIYRNEASLRELDFSEAGFEWLDASDAENSVVSFFRKPATGSERILVVFNLTPAVRHNYRLGVPEDGTWREILNTDAAEFGGSGQGNLGGVETTPVRSHGHPYSLNLTLPPLGAVFLKWDGV